MTQAHYMPQLHIFGFCLATGHQAHQQARVPAVHPDQRRAAPAVAAQGAAGDAGARRLGGALSHPRHAAARAAADRCWNQGLLILIAIPDCYGRQQALIVRAAWLGLTIRAAMSVLSRTVP